MLLQINEQISAFWKRSFKVTNNGTFVSEISSRVPEIAGDIQIFVHKLMMTQIVDYLGKYWSDAAHLAPVMYLK